MVRVHPSTHTLQHARHHGRPERVVHEDHQRLVGQIVFGSVGAHDLDGRASGLDPCEPGRVALRHGAQLPRELHANDFLEAFASRQHHGAPLARTQVHEHEVLVPHPRGPEHPPEVASRNRLVALHARAAFVLHRQVLQRHALARFRAVGAVEPAVENRSDLVRHHFARQPDRLRHAALPEAFGDLRHRADHGR
jgi:hypothetical protein